MKKKMKKKLILMSMIALTMGTTACASESKGDGVSVETDFRQETDKEEIADTKTAETNDVELPKPEITEAEENTVCDPIAGIVEKYEGSTITIKNPDDDMLYYFSTESAREPEGDLSIAVGDKVEVSYRGLIDFDEEHPSEAVKIVVITVE